MHDVVIFLGPSLERTEADAILRADYRPPAARGDITAALDEGSRVIVLIDGVFFQDCSVGHREILAALGRGTRVIGASSMGALRAAELDTLGMEGVGLVYRLYRDGNLVADDEVALIYDPETFAHLSEPLINIRCTIRKARSEGILNEAESATLLAVARALYFPDRTYEGVCEGARDRLSLETVSRFLEFCRTGAVDQKREDAREAIRRARDVARELGILS
ncbi:MAG: TfuA-related McrA-glycine thioamidation protein [Methanolinea sp.]|nr:TfuA-related McrA-glycine thioamidation protein [Methanolinea sp.]